MDLFYRYGKMKDQFGWPEDTEEIANSAAAGGSGGAQSSLSNMEDMSSSTVSQPVAGPLDKYVDFSVGFYLAEFLMKTDGCYNSSDLGRRWREGYLHKFFTFKPFVTMWHVPNFLPCSIYVAASMN